MKNLFSRNRRELPANQEPVLEARRLQEREENDRFMRRLHANQDALPGAGDAMPEASGAKDSRPAEPQGGASGAITAPAEPAAPAASAAPATSATSAPPAPPADLAGESGLHREREGLRAALELLTVARQLLDGREDVESRVARQLVARALDLLPPVPGRGDPRDAGGDARDLRGD